MRDRLENMINIYKDKHKYAQGEISLYIMKNIKRLVCVMNQYDLYYKNHAQEKRLHSLGLKLRKKLGIYIPEIKEEKKNENTKKNTKS